MVACRRSGVGGGPSIGVVGMDLGVVGAARLETGARAEVTRDHSDGVGDLDATSRRDFSCNAWLS